MPTAQLVTRRPTGKPPWPLIVIDGMEKSGKTYAGVSLAADPRVGQMFGFDLGEGSLDEYGPLSADPTTGEWKLQIVVHDGTYRSLSDQLQAAMAAPRVEPHLPNAILLDTGTDLWWSLARWIEMRSRYRAKNIELLRADPDAELDIGRDLWNDAAERWRNIVQPLRTWDGIAIITTRGGWVSGTDRNGQPTRTQVWSTNAHKSLPFDASVLIRMDEGRKASIVAARSLELVVPEGQSIALESGWSVGEIVFDRLKLDGHVTAARQLVKMTEGVPVPLAKRRLVEAFERAGHSEDDATTNAREAWARAQLPNGRTEEVETTVLVALVEAVSGPVSPSAASDAPLVAAPRPETPGEQPDGSSSASAASTPPVEDAREPDDGPVSVHDMSDEQLDEAPTDDPPPVSYTEDDRIEMVRAWIDSLDRDVLMPAMEQLGLEVTGSMPTLRKRAREHMIAAHWMPPEDRRQPAEPVEPEQTQHQAWVTYLAQRTADELHDIAQAHDAGDVNLLTLGGVSALADRICKSDEWPPQALVMS